MTLLDVHASLVSLDDEIMGRTLRIAVLSGEGKSVKYANLPTA
jgi:hypothetical protein